MRTLIATDVDMESSGGVQEVVHLLKRGLESKEGVVHQVNIIDENKKVNSIKVNKKKKNVLQIALTNPLNYPCEILGFSVPRPGSIFPVFSSLLRLSILLLRIRPEVVNVHFPRIRTFYFIFLRIFFRYKLVLSVHGSDISNPTTYNRKSLPFLLTCADEVTSVSQTLSEKVKDYAPQVSPHVIHNGIDVEYWRSATSPSLRSNGPPIIVTVGSLRREKGQDILIRAFDDVQKQIPNVRLRLVGDGGKKEELEKLTERYGLESQVSFTGGLDKSSVREELAKASVFAFPSRREGFGLALVEAMAAGLPIVATDVGGISEVVGENSGILVPSEDTDLLAEALVRVLTKPNLQTELRRAALKRSRHHSWGKMVEKYQYLFMQSVSKNS